MVWGPLDREPSLWINRELVELVYLFQGLLDVLVQNLVFALFKWLYKINFVHLIYTNIRALIEVRINHVLLNRTGRHQTGIKLTSVDHRVDPTLRSRACTSSSRSNNSLDDRVILNR